MIRIAKATTEVDEFCRPRSMHSLLPGHTQPTGLHLAISILWRQTCVLDPAQSLVLTVSIKSCKSRIYQAPSKLTSNLKIPTKIMVNLLFSAFPPRVAPHAS